MGRWSVGFPRKAKGHSWSPHGALCDFGCVGEVSEDLNGGEGIE